MRIWNPGKLLIIGSLLPTIVWAQAPIEQFASGVVQAHLAQGESGEAKLKTSIAMLAGKGGVVDARGLLGNQTITSTIEIPANTTVLLHPNVVYTCTVKDAPCWALTGNGARLLGTNAGANDVDAGSQTGTVLRMGRGVTSTTDMVVVNPHPAKNPIAGIELGGFVVDFGDLSSSTGRHGIAVYALNRSWIHDITILNPGQDGFHAETALWAHSYEVRMDRVFVRAAKRDGFRWNAAGEGSNQNINNLDFDKWTTNILHYSGFNYGARLDGKQNCTPYGGSGYQGGYRDPNNDGRFGQNGFSLIAGPKGGLAAVDDFDFENLFVAAVVCGGNGVLFQASGGSPQAPILRISINGEIEDDVGQNTGIAINAVPTVTSGIPNIQQIETNCFCGSNNQWSGSTRAPFNPTTIGPATVVGYSYRFDGIHLLRTDGAQVVPGTLPSASTYNPTGGWATFQGKDSDFLWYTDWSNVLHIARTDPGIARPTDYLLLDQANRALKPAENSSGSLGTPSNQWGSVNTSQLQLGNSYTFRNLPAAPNGTIIYCSDCNATCTAGSGTGRTCFRENGVWTH